jgi:hypothetical protein
VTPQIPWELSALYDQTAGNIAAGQNVLPLFGSAGVSPVIGGGSTDDDGNGKDPARRDVKSKRNVL